MWGISLHHITLCQTVAVNVTLPAGPLVPSLMDVSAVCRRGVVHCAVGRVSAGVFVQHDSLEVSKKNVVEMGSVWRCDVAVSSVFVDIIVSCNGPIVKKTDISPCVNTDKTQLFFNHKSRKEVIITLEMSMTGLHT